MRPDPTPVRLRGQCTGRPWSLVPRWQVTDDGRILELTEQELRDKLRRGRLSGMVAARPAGEETWRLLRTWPLFRDEVAVHGGQVGVGPRARRSRGFAVHLVVFVMVLAGLTAATGHVPSWWIWWALGLGIHGLTALPALRQRIHRGPSRRAEPAAESPHSVRAAAPDPQVAGLDAALASLEAATRDTGAAPDIDIGAVRAAGVALASRRARLAAAVPAGAAAALEQELAGAEVRASASPEVEDYALEVRALAQRLSGLRQAQASLQRLQARERALLHEVESLRLIVLQVDNQSAEAPALGDAVRRLRGEVAAAEEVDETLRRARPVATR